MMGASRVSSMEGRSAMCSPPVGEIVHTGLGRQFFLVPERSHLGPGLGEDEPLPEPVGDGVVTPVTEEDHSVGACRGTHRQLVVLDVVVASDALLDRTLAMRPRFLRGIGVVL